MRKPSGERCQRRRRDPLLRHVNSETGIRSGVAGFAAKRMHLRGGAAVNIIDHRLVEIALEYVDGQSFERFVNAFYSTLSGIDFVPLGGVRDGGADAVLERGIFEGAKSAYYQASTEENCRRKIRHTVRRLRDFGREPKSLTYVTPRPVQNIDREEEALSHETDVFIKIRDRRWIVAHINTNPATIAAFHSFLAPCVSFLNTIGGVNILTTKDRTPTRSVCVFLSQEVERRRRNSSLLQAVSDSLILWALEGTDPAKGKLMSRDQILEKIETTLPVAKRFIRGVIDARLELMATKQNPTGREVRWHRKEDKFCLPYETRRIAEEENAEDEFLKIRVLETFEERAQRLLDDGNDGEDLSAHRIAQIALLAIELTFEKEGLELAEFLTGQERDVYDCVADQVDEAIQLAGMGGNAAIVTKELALHIVRQAFYRSDETERLFFGKLARTYALLFSIQAEPRLIEYFQGMSANFRLYIGSDLIVRALSEHYLRPQDQMTVNMLTILRDAGSELFLTDFVLDEVVSHLRATDYEFINYFRPNEPYINNDLARHANKILIRAYFYVKNAPVDGQRAPRGWRSFIGQWCSYEDLHRSQGRQQIKGYLVEKFGMIFESAEVLTGLCDETEVHELAQSYCQSKGKRFSHSMTHDKSWQCMLSVKS
jgi:hypothetical protein